MKEKIYPVSYNADNYTVMANDLVKGKQAMTLREAKLLRAMISQVVKEDTDFKTYCIGIQDFADFLKIDSSNLYRDVQDLCEKLLKQVVKIKIATGKKNPWEMFHWVSYAKYDGNGTLTFRMSDEIKPYIIGLNAWYTQYQLKEILSLSSFYAIRLFELLKCQDGFTKGEKDFHEFSVEELRDFFECKEKYKTTAVFLLKTVYVAVQEINNKTNLLLTAEYKKQRTKGNPITGVNFYLQWFKSLEQKQDYVRFTSENKEKIEELFGQIKFE